MVKYNNVQSHCCIAINSADNPFSLFFLKKIKRSTLSGLFVEYYLVFTQFQSDLSIFIGMVFGNQLI